MFTTVAISRILFLIKKDSIIYLVLTSRLGSICLPLVQCEHSRRVAWLVKKHDIHDISAREVYLATLVT